MLTPPMDRFTQDKPTASNSSSFCASPSSSPSSSIRSNRLSMLATVTRLVLVVNPCRTRHVRSYLFLRRSIAGCLRERPLRKLLELTSAYHAQMVVPHHEFRPLLSIRRRSDSRDCDSQTSLNLVMHFSLIAALHLIGSLSH